MIVSDYEATPQSTEKGIIYAPWERTFNRDLTPFEEFIHRETIWQLSGETRFSQIAAVSVLGGIGFTMSIFIAERGFARQREYLLIAKSAVLAASLLACVIGFAWLWHLVRKP